MCIDPVISRIEHNEAIACIELEDYTQLPKVLAYADDITCLVKDKESMNESLKSMRQCLHVLV